jgi:hypothetical protein
MRRRKVTYPVPITSRRAAPTGTDPAQARPGLVTIDLKAGAGRAGIRIGDRVRIQGTGLYSGETAVVESLPGGVIPAALVRTENGQARRVRTIDLEPLGPEG